MKPSLTLLICTHNRADLLENMLSSIDAAVQPPGWTIEILVIANACTDRTHQLLQQRQALPANPDRPQLRWATEPRVGKSHALNQGVGMLNSDWVMLTDDDHRVDSKFLCAMTRAIGTYRETGLFCGRILPDWDGSEPAWVHETGRYRIYPPPIPVFDEGDTDKILSADGIIPGGGNLLVRTSVLQGYKGFSADMGPQGHNFGGGEDSEFVLDALRKGESLVYVPGIVQYHHVDRERLKLGKLLRLAYQRSRAITKARPRSGATLPLYLVRKLGVYSLSAIFSASRAKSCFYLVRTASAFGEMRGILERENR